MRRALIVVDVQDGFLTEENQWILPNIKRLLIEEHYDVVVEAIFHAEPGSLWEKQVKWTFPLEPTTPEIAAALPKHTIRTVKETKSAFKGDKDLAKMLRNAHIEEVHIVGLDTNDCAFATAQESFDLGFPTYVLEACTGSSQGPEYRDAALKILRELRMTK